MTRTELEFRINDVFAELASAPAPAKLLGAGTALLWAVIIGQTFPRLSLLLLLCSLFFAIGWTYGSANE